MVERTDIHSLLQTGSWKTSSRSRSPNPAQRNRRYDSYDGYDRRDRRDRYDGHETYEPPKSNIGVPRSKRPPRPFVEDEEESLAKESAAESVVSVTSDEEPKHRGEVDQMPIILPVHEHNPERRFVIVPDSGSSERDHGESDANKDFDEAKICRKYVIVPSDDSGKEDKGDRKDAGPSQRRGLPKRKSRQDLPRLDTHLDEQQDSASIRRSNSSRNREKAVVDQDPREPKNSRPPPDDAFLSPAASYIIGGLDREHQSYNTGRNGRSDHSPSARSHTRVASSDSRRSERPANGYSDSPAHKRASSTASGSLRENRTQERPRSAVYPIGDFGDPSNGFGNADDIMSFMAPGRVEFNPGNQRRNGSPPRRPKVPRSSNSPPFYPRRAGENMPIPIPIPYRPRSSRREQDGGYSSDDSFRSRQRLREESPRGGRPYPTRSTLEPEYPPLLSPDQARPQDAKTGSLLPSPRATQGDQLPDNSPLPSPRSAATFPVDRSRRPGDRSLSPSPPVSTSPSRRFADGGTGVPAGVHSRETSISSGSAPPRNRPVASLSRQESLDLRSPVLYWQPGRFDPPETSTAKVTSLRRYSDDVAKGLLPQLPDCPWKLPVPARHVAGSGHFMMLRGAENFIVCPDCYGQVFEKSGFQHLFLAAPPRTDDQLISCDFGGNVWYRIAFILTMKNQYLDLRLMLGISAVVARQQPCGGNQPATRIWYSMMGTNSRRPISSFTVCLSCAKTVEALLPNLAGVFVPLDGHEPTWGICDFHYDPRRKRFIDYFDMIETTSDAAVRQRTAPDILELADRIRHLSLLEECSRDTPMPNRKWYVMEEIPEFTVCEECFDDVVWPMLESEESGDIPRNFYRGRQMRQSAACQLYSTRMRSVFRLACQHNDMRLLESEVKARIRKQQDISSKYRFLQQEDQADPDVQREMTELVRQWKVIE